MRILQLPSVFTICVLGMWAAAGEKPRPITPSVATESDVCAAIDLVNRSIDQVLAGRKVPLLAERRQVLADEVYAQFTRCVADAKAVLQPVGDAHRYRIHAPLTSANKQAGGLHGQGLVVRGTLRDMARELTQTATPLPDVGFP